MSLLLAMFPFYLLGNLHCLGMCGPLVMMLGKHRYRHAYFLGRTTSFTLVALLAAEMGSLLSSSLDLIHLSALVSLFFGTVILVTGITILQGGSIMGGKWFAGVERSLTLLLLRDEIGSTFLFGFSTVFLPCGQSLIVFSACALSGDALTGLLNGLAFALLTSPSLYIAMKARGVLSRYKHIERPLMGTFAVVVALLAFCRAFADLQLIPHFTLSSRYHILLF